MTESIQRQLAFIESRAYRKYRRRLTDAEQADVIAQIRDRGKPLIERVTLRLKLFLEMERPVILPDTRIQGLRTLIEFPDVCSEEEMEDVRARYFVHERGKVCNLACDYGAVLTEGLEGRRDRLLRAAGRPGADPQFIRCALETIDIIEAFADRYADALDAAGQPDHAAMLRRVIRRGAKGMVEAMQLFRLVHFCLWAAGNYHCTVGRFDQYMLPFYEADRRAGMTQDQALELIEDFFLSFNRDSDLYYGIQQGDNGQSLVLGGHTPDGAPAYNDLTTLCLQASLELRQIDPKINLRVGKDTPFSLYQLGTELTRVGMGFPQYSNDDVVVPGLIRLGYDPRHARDYVMAACWEFIIPAVAMEIPNIGALSLAGVVHEAITRHLKDCPTYEDLVAIVDENLRAAVREMAAGLAPLYMEPSPMQSLLMGECVDTGRDISEGALYNNYGFHGTGFSCAVDQLAAVRQLVFEEKTLSPERLLDGLSDSFARDPELRQMLRSRAPKIGRDEAARDIGNDLLARFARSLEGLVNERGGIFRAGTGSAMYYLWHAGDLPATADGRMAGEPLPANFSPALFIRDTGPLSVVSSFALESLPLAVNGGPLTLELHDSVFRSPESIDKVARLVQAFILKGGHQLQLNAVNRERLLDAQRHPEKHPDLIVRVWGWSGHFVELDKGYQDQILSRVAFGLQ